uniref:Uncharacterized protein n=1 Tax=Ditylenchus dipsaci TaxID=166011 RepID=A0A915DQM3_9BILA
MLLGECVVGGCGRGCSHLPWFRHFQQLHYQHGGAKKAHDKVFQHNGGALSTSKTSKWRTLASFTKLVEPVQPGPENWPDDYNGDTATFTNIQVDSNVSYICQRYKDAAGTSKAGQYTPKQMEMALSASTPQPTLN